MSHEVPLPMPDYLDPIEPVDSGPRHLIVRVKDQLIVFRDIDGYGVQGPRCVAATSSRKKRCATSVQSNGQFGSWSEWHIADTGGEVDAVVCYDSEVEAFIRQRCDRHLESDAPDAVAPSWEMFDPVLHEDLIEYPYFPTWTPEGLKSVRRDGTVFKRSLDPFDEIDGIGDLLREARQARTEPPRRTALYRFYDADDVLLYIGISDHLATRHMSHVAESSWMEFAARSTIERHPTRAEAADAEVAAIRAESPLFNSQHNDEPDAVRRLVDYLIKHGRTDLLAPAVSRG